MVINIEYDEYVYFYLPSHSLYSAFRIYLTYYKYFIILCKNIQFFFMFYYAKFVVHNIINLYNYYTSIQLETKVLSLNTYNIIYIDPFPNNNWISIVVLFFIHYSS